MSTDHGYENKSTNHRFANHWYGSTLLDVRHGCGTYEVSRGPSLVHSRGMESPATSGSVLGCLAGFLRHHLFHEFTHCRDVTGRALLDPGFIALRGFFQVGGISL